MNDEQDEPRSASQKRYRHAGLETLAKFLGQHESLPDLDELARDTQFNEAEKIMQGMVDIGVGRYMDKKLDKFTGRLPTYIAILLVFLCVSIVLYFTRLRS